MNETNLHHAQSNRDAKVSDIESALTQVEQEAVRTRPSRATIAGHTSTVRGLLSELVAEAETDDEISEHRRVWMLVAVGGGLLLLLGHLFR